MVKDLICGMDVDPKTAVFKSVYEGKTYFFCNKSCKMTFDRDPKAYIEMEKNDDGMAKKSM
jgi:YHS domain-containing protein